MATSTTASQTELKQARVPISWRDQCSSLLIPLNVCRRDKLYLPWECETQRHAYEECQYKDYMRRMKALSKQKHSEAEDEE
ncbi:NADH-ubiquinone oxidoreductase B18 subunit-domain-containing protein [Phellopilus nigrolimitatus]|nr:NADH-ubiquinone oxidoreductase B18 subunit-domain-containing protein [Phellopilus nigrolimitatus]